jgi:hypothetical protein
MRAGGTRHPGPSQNASRPLPAGPSPAAARLPAAAAWRQPGADFGQLLAIEPRLASMFPPRDALYRDYVGVFNWIVAGYRTGIYRGPITFYWAREEPAIAQAWQPVIRCRRPDGNAEHLVAGALMSSVTEHIEGIAESLSEYLASADQGPFGAGEREAAEGCS